jgi:CTP:molybdopterin cytidylyltransferase MocA
VTIAALVLAAGGSSRFGGPTGKLLAQFRGRPLVCWSVAAAAEAGCDEVVVVDGATDLTGILPRDVTLLHNPSWAGGQATSLSVGLRWCHARGYDGVLVGLGDQPLIPGQAWAAVRLAPPAPVVVATYEGRRGHPVRLSNEVWRLLPNCGDSGARDLMRTQPEMVLEVACAGNPKDVDTVEDLARLD